MRSPAMNTAPAESGSPEAFGWAGGAELTGPWSPAAVNRTKLAAAPPGRATARSSPPPVAGR